MVLKNNKKIDIKNKDNNFKGKKIKIKVDNKHFKGKKGKITRVSTLFIEKMNKVKFGKKYLVKGDGLGGAIELVNGKIKSIPNSRWYYDFMLESDE